MKRYDVTKENKFTLSPEQKVALMEAKVKRAEAQLQALVEQTRILEQARRNVFGR
jgi:hypothetical protein